MMKCWSGITYNRSADEKYSAGDDEGLMGKLRACPLFLIGQVANQSLSVVAQEIHHRLK